MNRSFVAWSGVVIAIGCAFILPSLSTASVAVPSDAHPRSIIVKFSGDRAQTLSGLAKHSSDFRALGLARVAKDTGASSMERLSMHSERALSSYVKVSFDQDVDVAAVIRAFREARGVEAVGPNIRFRATFTPNDPRFDDQWNFEKIGAQDAWDHDTTSPKRGGDPSVVVAVIDTGVAYEDFGEFSQASDLADTNFVTGRNFVDDPANEHANDDNGHGTHVTGTIAENTNNDLLMAGLAYHTSIMPVKVLDETGNGFLDDVTEGIEFATINGADVINMSLGSTDDDLTGALQDAIDEAVAADIFVVASSGNDGDSAVLVPASYDNLVAVGSTGADDSISSFSNRGSKLDMVAPGEGIYQQTFSEGVGDTRPSDLSSFSAIALDGTSMAAPHVSAAAALLLAFGVDPDDVESTLTTTAVDLGTAGRDNTYGYGRLDLSGAFALVAGDTTAPTNATSIKAYTNSDRTTRINEATRTRENTPYFRWTGATDADSGIEGYYVYFGTRSDANPVTAGAFQTANTYQASRLSDANNKRYYLRVRARDGASNVSSNTLGFEYLFDRQASRPTNLVTDNVPSGVEITWDTPEGNVDFHRVYRSTARDGDYTYLARTTDTSYLDTSARDQKYFYKLTTKDDLGNTSIDSPIVSQHFYPADDIVVGAGEGHAPEVSIFRADGTLIRRFMAFTANDLCGVNVAVADIDNNGANDIITGSGPGCTPEVKVFDLRGVQIVSTFTPYDASVKSGVFVAAGNVDTDSKGEIVTGVRRNAGPHVRVFDHRGQLEHSPGWFAYSGAVRNGVYPTVGNINSSDQDEIVTGVEGGHGAHVRPFNHRGEGIHTPGWFPYSGNVGVHVAVGDFDDDGRGEIATVPASGAPTVRYYNYIGQSDVNSGFTAFTGVSGSGAFLAAGDVDQDGRDDLIMSFSVDGPPTVRAYNASGTRILSEFTALSDSNFRGGLPLAAGRNLD